MVDTAVTLEASDDGIPVRVQVEIDLVAGGRIRQITVADDRDAVGLLADTGDTDPSSTGWGSFPMAPWAGRIRHGRFSFLGDDVHLDLNHTDGTGTGGGPITPPHPAPAGAISGDDLRRHTIHGTTFGRPWDVVGRSADRVEMCCRLDGALGWPYPGTARQIVSLTPQRLELQLMVEPDPGVTLPATVGWHPWFAKPDHLDLEPLAMYARDELGLPTGELVAPTPPPWDDCFIVHRPVELGYERSLAPVVRVSSDDCDHWVVYDMPAHATCVEPQSGPPDAPNIRPDFATSARPVRRTMRISW